MLLLVNFLGMLVHVWSYISCHFKSVENNEFKNPCIRKRLEFRARHKTHQLISHTRFFAMLFNCNWSLNTINSYIITTWLLTNVYSHKTTICNIIFHFNLNPNGLFQTIIYNIYFKDTTNVSNACCGCCIIHSHKQKDVIWIHHVFVNLVLSACYINF